MGSDYDNVPRCRGGKLASQGQQVALCGYREEGLGVMPCVRNSLAQFPAFFFHIYFSQKFQPVLLLLQKGSNKARMCANLHKQKLLEAVVEFKSNRL